MEQNNILKHIPNLLTSLNLFCGFLSILFVSINEFTIGILILIGSFFFDVFDGLIARKLNWQSKIGIELDSLADAVSFVVAPAFFIYKYYFNDLLGLLVVFFILTFGIYRLAKFNLISTKKYFEGMPTPQFTTVIMILFFIDHFNTTFNFSKIGLGIFLIMLSYLMISKIKFPNFKEKGFLKYKLIIGIIIFGFFISLFIKQFVILLILLELILFFVMIIFFWSKLLTNKFNYILYFILFLVLSIICNYLFFGTNLMLAIPLLFLVIFSPMVQKSIKQ